MNGKVSQVFKLLSWDNVVRPDLDEEHECKIWSHIIGFLDEPCHSLRFPRFILDNIGPSTQSSRITGFSSMITGVTLVSGPSSHA